MPDGAKFCTQCGTDLTDPGSGPRTPGAAEQTAPTSVGGVNLYDRLKAALGDRYEMGDLLGRGGMGAVFKATDTALERPVAVKVLPPELAHDDKFVGRFEREARTAAKLDHPGIIPIYAVEHKEDLYYFVMKYVTGRSLDQLIAAGPLPIDTCQRILWESACALGHAHQRGVVHRDVKPANIMIDDAGRAMLTDFGISKQSQAASQFTATGQVIGTPHYMSPEQAKGIAVDGRSDQYSLGVVGYKMLSGRLPFAEESVHTVIYKHIFEEATPVEQIRTDCPANVAAAIKRAMAKAPEDRFGSMEEFATMIWPENPVAGPSGTVPAASVTGPSITDAATQLTPPSGSVSSSPQRPASKKRVPAVALVGALFAIVGGAAGVWWLTSGAPDEPVAEGSATGQTVAGDPTAAPPPVTAATEDSSETQASTQQPTQQPATTQAPTSRPAGPVQTPTRTETATQTPTQAPPRTQTPTRQPATQPAPVEPAPAPARRVGQLTVVASPFGRVSVDGLDVGDSPLTNHTLTVGQHVIVVRKEGYVTVTDTVQIQLGSTLRRTYRLRQGGL
jgi:serine/threonine-protein kinase